MSLLIIWFYWSAFLILWLICNENTMAYIKYLWSYIIWTMVTVHSYTRLNRCWCCGCISFAFSVDAAIQNCHIGICFRFIETATQWANLAWVLNCQQIANCFIIIISNETYHCMRHSNNRNKHIPDTNRHSLSLPLNEYLGMYSFQYYIWKILLYFEHCIC